MVKYDYEGKWIKMRRHNLWTGKLERKEFRILVKPNGEMIKEERKLK